MFGTQAIKDVNNEFGPKGPNAFHRKLNQLADTKNIDTINENDESDIENHITSRKTKLNIYLQNDEITDKEKEELEEYIKDFTIRLFSSEDLKIYNQKLKTEIQNAISSNYGRHYFIKIL